MASLVIVTRRMWMFTVLSVMFFLASLIPVIMNDTLATSLPTFFCDSTQLQLARSTIMAMPWTTTCARATDFVNAFLPTTLDVMNRPLSPPSSQGLSGFCTADCTDGIQSLRFFPFPPCDTIMDGTVRAMGSVAQSLCPNGASVKNIPPAPTDADRAGYYCPYPMLDEYFGTVGLVPLKTSGACSANARQVFFPDVVLANGIPQDPITLDMVNQICVPACASLVQKLKNQTYGCDTIVNNRTISLNDLTTRMCTMYDVTNRTTNTSTPTL
ncbi:Aste57867_16365 [Aphanomyces stellatus]|uniref:Aste57867_16365 protein n=1 Tax=Aphanomyces stellatus TaxID=120398 RepID=A0A485L5A1_9STRA|nr:hypothetical protein As57867_016308 [Aphanomyces stellatus]VFT93141.1 Aste57867_16365 [Aphanomyces stellatus]